MGEGFDEKVEKIRDKIYSIVIDFKIDKVLLLVLKVAKRF